MKQFFVDFQACPYITPWDLDLSFKSFYFYCGTLWVTLLIRFPVASTRTLTTREICVIVTSEHADFPRDVLRCYLLDRFLDYLLSLALSELVSCNRFAHDFTPRDVHADSPNCFAPYNDSRSHFIGLG